MTNSTTLDQKRYLEDNALGRILAPVTGKWWLPLVTGIAWLVVSVVIFRFDYTTVTAVGVLFGIVAIGSAANEALLAGISTTGWRIAHLLFGALSLVVGIISFVHPGDTFVALAALVGFYLIFRGWFDIIQGFSVSRYVAGWWLIAITGVAELVIGFWAAGSWNNSVVTLVAWVGAAALMRGITEIVAAFQLREVGHVLSH